MNQEVRTKIDEAEDLFQKAKEELCKPEEDVVPYAICQNAYNSVASYLSGVLINHNIPLPDPISIDALIKSCRSLDPKYNDLHLSPMYHPKEIEDVWMNLDTAKDFLSMAENTRQMVNLT